MPTTPQWPHVATINVKFTPGKEGRRMGDVEQLGVALRDAMLKELRILGYAPEKVEAVMSYGYEQGSYKLLG